MTEARLFPSLDVEGCFNVRDAGGWSASDGRTMSSGRLYRADEPQRLSPAGRAVIDGIGLRAVIDLRSEKHFERGPGFADAALTHNVTVVDRVIHNEEPRRVESPADIADLYDEMVELRRDNIVRAVELVADNIGTGPVLVHCMAGKDRTGIVVALIQAALSVSLASIVEEYSRSDEPTRQRRVEMIAHPHPGDPDVAAAPEMIWTAPAEAMEIFATRAIARHGSLEVWPLAIGVPDQTVKALREYLLEP
jgi:protein-tyrosine phosphatase